MPDFIKTLVEDVRRNVDRGYYDSPLKVDRAHNNLVEAIVGASKVAIIAEIKFASPSAGVLRKHEDPIEIALSMQKGEAAALSILTEPTHFDGSLENFSAIARAVKLPLIMKDIVMSRRQIDAASKIGADAILFISTIFREGYLTEKLEDLIDYAHSKGLEVILENHSEDEFTNALNSEADLIGINNRDLKTFDVNLETTERILGRVNKLGRIVISESGIKSSEDIRRLHRLGVKAFLVGSSIMATQDVEAKVKELATAI